MTGSDKAVIWVANDFSEGKGTQEKFAVKVTTIDRKCYWNIRIVLNSFKENFNKAREFNRLLKEDPSKLVMAPILVEKKEEPVPVKEEKKVEAEKKPEAPKLAEPKK